MAFTDRVEAGRQLASRLTLMRLDRPVVYALPPGGVPVAAEISQTLQTLQTLLDLVLVRKIGTPLDSDVALGTVVEDAVPQTTLNDNLQKASGADDALSNANETLNRPGWSAAANSIWEAGTGRPEGSNGDPCR